MGQLNIPVSSRVYLDTTPIIYTVERIPDYFQLLRPILSIVNLAEVLAS